MHSELTHSWPLDMAYTILAVSFVHIGAAFIPHSIQSVHSAQMSTHDPIGRNIVHIVIILVE